jgi:hypothetical protein
MSHPDPIRQLQHTAHMAAFFVLPGTPAARVIVCGDDGKKIIDIAIPPQCALGQDPDVRPALKGWLFTDRTASFEGRSVAVGACRVKLLRVLAGAEMPLSAKELAKAAFGDHADEENARFHVRELRKELKAALEWDGEPIPNDGDGYRLVLR